MTASSEYCKSLGFLHLFKGIKVEEEVEEEKIVSKLILEFCKI